MVAACLSLVAAWVIGFLATCLCWPRQRAIGPDLPLLLPLGLGLGLGITSVTFFVTSLFPGRIASIPSIVDLALVSALYWGVVRRRGGSPPAAGATGWMGWKTAIAASLFAQACVVALVAASRAYQAEPHGSWDAWAIWNLHARIMYRGGSGWPALLRAPEMAWSHLDYPLLVSASVARAWSYVGGETNFAAGLVSTAFGAATVWLLVGAVSRIRGSFAGFIGGLALVGTPAFATISSNEHADVPLGFFILATFVVIALSAESPGTRGLTLLAGVAAGLAAWTKNEGMLFVLVVGALWLADAIRRRALPEIAPLAAGIAAALVPVICFKIWLAPPGDLFSAETVHRAGNLVDVSRYKLILSSLWRDLARFGGWGVAPFAVLGLALVANARRRLARTEWLTGLALAATAAGYFAVYLLTPWDLAWHLDTSLVRLLLQLWPSALFAWCLVVGDRSPAAGAVPPRGRSLGLFVAANAFAAVALLTVLTRQLAANELARSRIGGGEVRVGAVGWFGRERNVRDTWVWSGGESSLDLRFDGENPVKTTLQFQIRGLGQRSVAATLQNRRIWEGSAGTGLERVVIRDVVLSPGSNAISFSTDAAPVAESPAADARKLAFAVYDLTVE